MMSETVQSLQNKLQKSLQVIRMFEWLLDTYVLDFYVEENWSKLSLGWQTFFYNLNLENLTYLLEDSKVTENELHKICPLGLLCLKVLLGKLCVSREVNQKYLDTLPRSDLLTHNKLKHVFTKCVKPKKRHELQQMAALCKRSSDDAKVDFVVDFGAGLGHLARVLGYAYNVRVCCLEMQDSLNVQASIIDDKLELLANKYLPSKDLDKFQRPHHITLRLTADMTAQQFITKLKDELKLKDEDFRFGIIGLHPCGDLAPILMRLFLNCKQAKFLNFVSCCYMKLTTALTQVDNKTYGYPLSQFLQNDKTFTNLSYEALEISCHATETYCDRLLIGDYEYLKVHSFRAAVEKILVKKWPSLKHCGLKSVKHVQGMEFEHYYYKAVQGLPAAEIPLEELHTSETLTDLAQWKRVVVFYTLRLMFAPLVESIVLYDRMLFLMENDCKVKIHAIFDPRLSPRNHITMAIKDG
ncbi:protein RRNAD1 [Teleopsis dalmanni]|uniref:protein RRNAD1 n=1 Tax=Teleopsis dalmanni TaxID=139649 RepID=UPI0018CFAF1C|nr:protein RRNAD1 [Teleopsis dalmanni]